MKLFKLYLSFFLIAGLFFGISLFFPRIYKFERSITIHKPVPEVFAYMNNLRSWESWSAWNKTTDSTMYMFYSRRSDSLGARQYFNGTLLGSGQFTISNYQPNDFFSYHLHMHNGDVNANGTFYFRNIGNATELSWVDSGDVGYNPIFRYMIPSKKKSTEAAFEDGLKRIKANLEK
jgi:hypothetical protein